jgi:hypothetical protein
VDLTLKNIAGEKTINRRNISYINMEKLKYSSIAITSLGILFKTMHWPYAGYLYTVGFTMVIIYCLIKIFKS